MKRQVTPKRERQRLGVDKRGKNIHPVTKMPIFDEAAIKAKAPLEKVVEGKVRAYAIKQGCLCRKFTSPSQRSVPDRIIITPRGVVGFLEMKRKGKEPTPSQYKEQALLMGRGCNVAWSDCFEGGKAFVDKLMALDALQFVDDEPDLSDL